jgi:hypothetical protein
MIITNMRAVMLMGIVVMTVLLDGMAPKMMAGTMMVMASVMPVMLMLIMMVVQVTKT